MITPSDNAMQAFATLQRTLRELDWDPRSCDVEGVLHVEFGTGEAPVRGALAAIAMDTERFLFYLDFRGFVPAGRRSEMCRHVTRINWGLSIGNFELDERDGHLRFKVSVDFRGTELSERLVDNAILSAMTTVEHYGPELMQLANGPA